MFNIDDGAPIYRSALGACFTIFIAIVTLSFTIQQIGVVIEHKGTLFTTSIAINAVSDDEEFTVNNGFFIAFGIVDETTGGQGDPNGVPLEEYFTIEATQPEGQL